MTSDYPARRRALALAQRAKESPPPRKWNNRERWRTARLVIRVFLCYSPRGIGNALIIAGMLINCIDQTWEKDDGKK